MGQFTWLTGLLYQQRTAVGNTRPPTSSCSTAAQADFKHHRFQTKPDLLTDGLKRREAACTSRRLMAESEDDIRLLPAELD